MSELEVFEQADWVEPDRRFVFWSGGKDSTVALHLALRAWGIRTSVVFIDTGITIPETLEYIKQIRDLWNLNLTVLEADIDFWLYVAKNGFPHKRMLWCRRLLKMVPIKEFLSSKPGWKVQVLGIYRSESNVRKKSWYYRKPFLRHSKLPFTYNLLPILDWRRKHVERYIRRVQIPINAAWKTYKSSGCYFCPFVRNPAHYLMLKKNHPELFNKIVYAEQVMRNKKPPWPRKSIIPIAEQTRLPVEEKTTKR